MNTELEKSSQNGIDEGQWDILRPENNGIGEFTNIAIESEFDIADSVKTEGLEVEPILVDAHNTKRAWDPGSTDILTCNVLDEHWLPDIDDSRPNEMTISERFEELRKRTQFLDDLEDHLRNPNPRNEWMFTGIDKTVENFRENYLEQLERQRSNPDEPQIDIAVKNTHDWLVEVRTYQFLASDPKQRRKEIEYEQAGLGQVLAAQDQRYESAFTEVDRSTLEQDLDRILDHIPKRNFRALASLIGEDGVASERFKTRASKVIMEALKLKASQLEFGIFDDPDSNLYGNCRNLGRGRSLIKLNQAKSSEALQFANTLAHEMFHAKQHSIQYTENDKASGQFYEYCSTYYIPPEFDYQKYASQYTEAEAFYFGNEFSQRITQAQESSKGDLIGKLRHKMRKQ